MQNQFENDQLVMHNDPIDCYNRLPFLKENNISHSILQYNSTLFAEFLLLFVNIQGCFYYIDSNFVQFILIF